MKRKLVIIGHAGHGKTTVSKVMAKLYNYRLKDPTDFIAEHIMVKNGYYRNFYDALYYKDSEREKWFKAVETYNLSDNTRLVSNIFEHSDIYAGIRKYEELEDVKKKFNPIVIWVENKNVKPEPETSCTVKIEQADFVINNPGTLNELYKDVVSLYTQMVYTRKTTPDWII